MLERAAGDERVGCVLLDVVLGFASHPDPAGGLADAVRRVAERAVVIAHVCGTPDDPQDSRRQTSTLARRGRDRRPVQRGGGTARAEGAQMRPLRIAMLTYSLRPRGGVVHALEISDALARRGHEVELIALGPPGEDFFREPGGAVADRPLPADRRPVRRAHHGDARRLPGRPGRTARRRAVRPDPLPGLPVGERGARAPRRRRRPARDPHRPPRRRLHLAVAGRVPGPLDPPPRRAAVRVGAVGRTTGERVRHARRAGPQRSRHPPLPAARATRPSAGAAATAFGLGDRFAVLTIGGIEPRKGSLTLLEGFARLRELAPELDALLVVAGGATLFDYRDEVDRFHARVAELGLEDSVARARQPPRSRDRVAVPGRRRVRVPLDQGGLRARRARGARVRASGGRVRARRVHDVPRSTARARCSFRSATATRSEPRWPGSAALAGDSLRAPSRWPARRRAITPGTAPRSSTSASTASCSCRSTLSVPAVSEPAEVTATWLRGFEARVETRGHVIAVDEPVEDGGDRCRRDADRAAGRLDRELLLPRARVHRRQARPRAARPRRSSSGGSARGASFATSGSRSKLEPRSPRRSSRR